jgi:hypothetical protein
MIDIVQYIKKESQNVIFIGNHQMSITVQVFILPPILINKNPVTQKTTQNFNKKLFIQLYKDQLLDQKLYLHSLTLKIIVPTVCTVWGDQTQTTCCRHTASTDGGVVRGRLAKTDGWWAKCWRKWGGGG